MPKEDPSIAKYSRCYKSIMIELENNYYPDMETFYEANQIMDEHPNFDIAEITKKMSIDILNMKEMTSQEATQYLLREPMSKSSVQTPYIPTVWPIERQRIRRT
ncbi:uncharacterized protein TNCV_2905001 [Trichonephila clavipes]|nr:uncharacterized protein TNCV_2905001 [Trichonephila clavipes]